MFIDLGFKRGAVVFVPCSGGKITEKILTMTPLKMIDLFPELLDREGTLLMTAIPFFEGARRILSKLTKHLIRIRLLLKWG